MNYFSRDNQASYSAPKHIFIYTTHIKHVRDRPNHEQMRLRRVCEQKNANEESRFAGTSEISASFFFIFLIDYCGCVSSRGRGRGRDKMQRSRVFHRRRLLSVVDVVAWTKRRRIRAKEVFVRENVHIRARSRGRARVTR